MRARFGIIAALALATSALQAQAGDPMTQAELAELTSGGVTILLGGPGEGYSGTLVLAADGTGAGTAKTDSGTELTLTGTWEVRDGKFCRSWQEFDDGAEVCETWILTGENSADVFNGDQKIGVNSW